jgi:hypothetical protein
MPLFAMAVPILPGKTEQWLKLAGELQGARRAEFLASRDRLGIRERAFLQRGGREDVVIVTFEGDDPVGALAQLGQGDDAFTLWFVEQVKEIHGMDLTQPPAGPLPQQVTDSRGELMQTPKRHLGTIER